MPSRNGAAVISFPTRKGKLPQARMLVRHGFGVLLLDARGYDGSDGDSNVFGWGAAKDIDAAVTWLRKQPDVHDGRIGGIGFSVGGEMMLEAAADNAGLHAVVSEGAGARSIREDLIRGPRGWLVVPQAAVQTTALAVLSGTAPPPSLERLVRRIAPRPLYLIYAGRSSAGEDLNLDYFRSASEPKTLWKISEASHVGGFQARPREYERRVSQFFESALLAPRGMSADAESRVDLYWLPLGAGGHSVRWNGRVFEAVAAALGGRPRRDLYHSALEVRVPEGRFVIEQAPVRDRNGFERGVVSEGAVGSHWAGRLRIFRYEVRCWCGGLIPDVDEAVESPQRLTDDADVARRVLDLVAAVPAPVWGRDELAAGEMWNSNSVIAWLIARGGLATESIQPPAGGRAPGWHAGLVVASRQD